MEKWLSALGMRLERVLFLLGRDQVDQNVVPSRGDRLEWRSNAAFVSKFDKLPARHLDQRIAAARGGRFGMHDFAVAKKHQSILGFFNQLERAAAPAETTHLQKIDNVENIGRIRWHVLGSLDRAQQSISFNRFWKNFGRGNFQALLGRGIIWK